MSGADRLALLRRAVVDKPGPWTTREVQRLYTAHGLYVPSRKTARNDLAHLARQGLLVQRGPENGRFYTLNTWNGAAS